MAGEPQTTGNAEITRLRCALADIQEALPETLAEAQDMATRALQGADAWHEAEEDTPLPASAAHFAAGYGLAMRHADAAVLRRLLRQALEHSEQVGDVTAPEMTWRAEARAALGVPFGAALEDYPLLDAPDE